MKKSPTDLPTKTDVFKIVSSAGGDVEFSETIPEHIAYERIHCTHTRFARGEWGYMVFQEIRGQKSSLWDSQYFPTCDMTLYGSADVPVFELYSSVKNHFLCWWDGVGLPTQRPGCGGFSYTPYVDNKAAFSGGQCYRTADFHFHPELLIPFANAYEKLYSVMDLAGKKKANSIDPGFVLNADMKVILQQIRDPRCAAGIQSRYFQLKSEEYLIATLQQMHAASIRQPFALNSSLKEKAEQVEHILHERLNDPPSLTELVSMVSSNMQYIQQAFKARYGMPIFKYLHELRMAYAKELLMEPSLSLLDIALETGLYDAARLSNAFYARYGIRPSEFRRVGRVRNE